MPQFDGIIPELARAGYFNKINGIEAGIEDVYAQIGSPNGIAPLGENGLIEPQYLPSYVDDVLEYPDYESLPVAGEQGKIYITVDETKVWRWSGTVYIEIVASPSSTDSVLEGLNNLYYTAERAQSDVVNIAGNADTANRLSTARIIQLSGGVTGSGLFNGGSNLTIAATVVDDSHNHSTSTIEGLSDVATSGDYSDLLNKPILGSSASKDVPITGNATDSQVVLGNDTRLSDDRKASDVWEWAKQPNKPTYTATEVGAQVQSDDLDSISGLIGTSGVLRKIGENQYELAQDVVVDSDLTPLSNTIAGKVDSSLLGVVNGVATLDGNGDIPLSQLPTHNHTIANVTNLQTVLDGKLGVSDTAVAATTLTGLTSTITELNYVDGVTSNVQTQLNSKVNSSQLGVSNGVATLDANGDIPLTQLPTHSHVISDIVNLQTTLNGKLGVSDTAIAATTLTGLTPTITELNYVDGVTSNVQTQLNGKQPLSAELTGIAGISATSGLIKKTGAGTYALDSTVYTSVGSVTPLVDSGSTGVVGVSTTAARSDHVHPVATSVLSNSASTTSVSVGISTNGVAGTSTSISAATTSQAGVMSNSQVVSLNTAISDISTLQTTVAGKEPSFSVLPVSKGGTGASSLSGVLKGNGTSQLLAATSTDILALVPDATVSQSGKMTTSQVSSLNELGGLVSMGSGVVKKTLSTTGLDTYTTAVIADLVTSTNVVTNLNADMLDGFHVNNASITASAHIPSIGADGVIELGKFIDFHTAPGQDFDVRLEAARPVDTANKANLFISGGTTVREKLWHGGNHGANSGLDADLLDGNHASAFALSGHTHNTLDSVTGTGVGLLYKSSTSEAGTYSSAQIASLTTRGLTVSSITTNGLINLTLDSGLDSFAGFSDNSANVGIVKLSAVDSFAKATSSDILALVPDATVSQSGKMTTSQVNSLNELSGLVSMGSGVVKKTLNTSSIDTYSIATIADLVTSTNVVANLNAGMLDGFHVNRAGSTTLAHIPFVGSDSVMEIGKYIDFHAVLGNDYELRLEAMPVTTSQSADLRVYGGRTASARVWHSDNHGANSGLDADTLDGNHASAFSLSGHGHSIATTLADGFMSSTQVASLNELGGLVSLGSGVVKKTLSTDGVSTYSTAAISDLATSGTGISIGSNQISLATLADSGTGSLLKLTRDAYGRVSGTSTVTASDIPLDATLAALAGVTVTADKLIYATAPDAFSTTGFTAFARTLMDDSTDSEARSTLGIGSYGKYAKLVTDWNSANENGVFMGNTSCLNSPEAGYWSMGHVENHGGAGWCTQFVHCFANDAPTNTRTYRRELNNGVWASNWERVLLTEQEQRLAFLSLTGGTLTGNLVLSGATGLRFSNTVDSSTTNTLSWYETGTYTPVLSGGTTAGTFTYSTQLGRYTRIGRMVYIDVNVTTTGASTVPAGNLYISLPTTTISDTDRLSQSATITNNLTITGQVFVQTQSGSTNASVLVVNNGVSTAMSSSNDTTFTIKFSLAYVAA